MVEWDANPSLTPNSLGRERFQVVANFYGSSRRLTLGCFRPAARVMISAQDLQHVVVYTVGDNEGSFGDDEFARPWHAAGMTTSPTWSVGLFSWISPNGGGGLLARQ